MDIFGTWSDVRYCFKILFTAIEVSKDLLLYLQNAYMGLVASWIDVRYWSKV